MRSCSGNRKSRRKRHDSHQSSDAKRGLAVWLATAGIPPASAQQLIAPASATPTPGPMPDILQKYAPVTAERLKKPEDGNWLMFRRTYDGWGYSPLGGHQPRKREPFAAGLELRL